MIENPDISYVTRSLPYYFGTAEKEPRDFEGNVCSEPEQFRDSIKPGWKSKLNYLPSSTLNTKLEELGAYDFLGIKKKKQYRTAIKINNLIRDWESANCYKFPSLERRDPGYLYLDNTLKNERLCPTILFSKVCKEGTVLKIGLNNTFKVGQGSLHTAVVFPVISISRKGRKLSITAKSKTLLYQDREHRPHIRRNVNLLETSLRLQKEALKGNSSLFTPLPRRLQSIPGVYIQRYFSDNLFRAKKYLNQETKLKALEKTARAISLLHRKEISHFDIRPENILVTKNKESYLADFDTSGKFRESALVTTDLYPYRGHLYHQAEESGKALLHTPGCDLVGLAITIAEIFFPNINHKTDFKAWLDRGNPKRKEFVDSLNSFQQQLFFRVVLPILQIDNAFNPDIPNITAKEFAQQASKSFSYVNADWVANQLKTLREELYPPVNESPMSTFQKTKTWIEELKTTFPQLPSSTKNDSTFKINPFD